MRSPPGRPLAVEIGPAVNNFALRRAARLAGLGAKELCRKHGIGDATFHKWRSKYGGMEVSDARRLKALESESA
jgi:transposase-like protein